jgi:hypothetical protein
MSNPQLNPRAMGKRQRLTVALLKDRERRKAAKAAKPPAKVKPRTEAFAPLKERPAGPWRVVAGGNSGYLPPTPMRMGSVGWFIRCVGCGTEFESIGLAHCGAAECRAAALRRKSTTEGYVPSPPRAGARLCECGCGRSIPVWRKTKTEGGKITTRRVSKAVRFFSEQCQRKASQGVLSYPPSAPPKFDGETLQKCPKNGPSREAIFGPTNFPINLTGGYRHSEAPALESELRRSILATESPLDPKLAASVKRHNDRLGGDNAQTRSRDL